MDCGKGIERMRTGPLHDFVTQVSCHDDVIKWKHFPHYWPFVWGNHRSPVISPHEGQWRGAFMFSLICAWINGSVNNREAGDLIRHCAHYDVTVMVLSNLSWSVFDTDWCDTKNRCSFNQQPYDTYGEINYFHANSPYVIILCHLLRGVQHKHTPSLDNCGEYHNQI